MHSSWQKGLRIQKWPWQVISAWEACTVRNLSPWANIVHALLNTGQRATHTITTTPLMTGFLGSASESWLALHDFIKTGDLSRSQTLLVQDLTFCLDPSRLFLPLHRHFCLSQSAWWSARKINYSYNVTWQSRTTACFLDPPLAFS